MLRFAAYCIGNFEKGIKSIRTIGLRPFLLLAAYATTPTNKKALPGSEDVLGWRQREGRCPTPTLDISAQH